MYNFFTLVSAMFIGILVWQLCRMLWFCCYWAIQDTIVVASKLKPNLSYWVIVKGLAKTYWLTFSNTFLDRLDGQVRTR